MLTRPWLPCFTVQVLKMLGEGGSGETWLCKDLRTGDELAIKFIQRPIPKIVLPMIFHEVKVRGLQPACMHAWAFAAQGTIASPGSGVGLGK